MNNLSEFIDENIRGLKPPYSYSEVEEILEKCRNAVLSDLETMLDDAIFHCNATGSSGESVMAYQSIKTLLNTLKHE